MHPAAGMRQGTVCADVFKEAPRPTLLAVGGFDNPRLVGIKRARCNGEHMHAGTRPAADRIEAGKLRYGAIVKATGMKAD